MAGQIAAGKELYWPFLFTALIPIIVSLLIGRIFCGWVCPATLIYELNDKLRSWMARYQLPVGELKLNLRLKYWVLLVGVILSFITGSVLVAAFYPPAIVGRELYYVIAFSGFGVGAVFFLLTLLGDLFVAKRSFCRYLCPGGALYSLLGRYRLVRIKRNVETCNDCKKCNQVYQFGLDPLRDDFGQECNNYSTCIAVCPSDALQFTLNTHDTPYQRPGHRGRQYRQHKSSTEKKRQAA